MYLISDDYGNDKEILNYKELKGVLVDELIKDIRENIDDKDIINDNVAKLETLAKNDSPDEEYIKKALIDYGYKTLNIDDILVGIEDIREYYARENSNLKAFDEVMDIIERLK